MAHSSLKGHFKLRALAKLLDLSQPAASGYLNYLWWSAYARPDVGADGIMHGWGVRQIAQCCEWDGDADMFVDALCESGFLDRLEGEFAVHDYHDWAPRYVQRRKVWAPVGDNGRPLPSLGADGRQPNVTKPNLTSLPAAQVSTKPVKKKAPTTSKPRKPDHIWDAVADLCCPGGNLTPGDKKRIGRLTADLKTKQATPDEIRVRFGRAQRKWPEMTVTLNAVLKHWDALANDPAPTGNPGVVKPPKGKYDNV